MTEPATLFDMPLEGYIPVRHDDPETSRHAAHSLKLKERKREVLAALDRLPAGVTCDEIKVEMTRQGVIRERGTIASRLSQLEHDGLVRRCGCKQIPRSEGGTGRPAIMWSRVR